MRRGDLILYKPAKPNLATCSGDEFYAYYDKFKTHYKEANERAAEIDVSAKKKRTMYDLISAFVNDVKGIFDPQNENYRKDNIDFMFNLMLEIFDRNEIGARKDFQTFYDVLSDSRHGRTPLVSVENLDVRIAQNFSPNHDQNPVEIPPSPPQIRKEILLPPSPNTPRKPSPLRKVANAENIESVSSKGPSAKLSPTEKSAFSEFSKGSSQAKNHHNNGGVRW